MTATAPFGFWYGADYNPEQWPQEVRTQDLGLMQQAGVTIATVGVFSWALLEPREGEYDFAWLDRVMDDLHAAGIKVDLATATASPPAWLGLNYPETRPVTAEGVALIHGSRQAYSPSSRTYRAHAARLVQALAERYGTHPALYAWHVGNEYGCHVSRCYGEESAIAFRAWLERRYETVEALNHAWGTAFWSQRYDSFDEVLPPRATPTFANPGHVLDFDRFSSDALLECYRTEVAVLRAATPEIPITTNFMGFFEPLDYWQWAAEVDFISDDHYPDPADPRSPMIAAMSRDLMRSLGRGKPWILMEQSTSAVNWRLRNAPKAPGEMRAYSHQAIARGADGIMFFQWRQSGAGAEKFHSGMVPIAGLETRIWREVVELGAELPELTDALGAESRSRVAIVLDWPSWWSLRQEAVPAQLDYLELLRHWYRPFYAANAPVDFVPASADLSGYRVVVAPAAFLLSAEQIAGLHAFVEGGGHLLATFQTGIIDDAGRFPAESYLGGLQRTLGLRIEEFAPLVAADPAQIGVTPPTVALEGQGWASARGSLWSEHLVLEGAEPLARFAEGHAAGSAAITRHALGEGVGWYAATLPDEAATEQLIARILVDAGVGTPFAGLPYGLEVVQRGGRLWAVNFSAGTVRLAPAQLGALPRETAAGASLELPRFGVATWRVEA